MGVSQWRNHGKKYGYWEYFEKKVVEMVEKVKNPHSHLYDPNEWHTFEEAREAFLPILKEKK